MKTSLDTFDDFPIYYSSRTRRNILNNFLNVHSKLRTSVTVRSLSARENFVKSTRLTSPLFIAFDYLLLSNGPSLFSVFLNDKSTVKCQRSSIMSSLNNSVIICDEPVTSPVKNHVWSKAVTNYRKRLRSSDHCHALLDTPYESPLSHFRRNLRPIIEASEDVKDVTVVSGPPAKKQKTQNADFKRLYSLDESVVIVADKRTWSAKERDSDASVLDSEGIDVVEIPEESRAPDLPHSSGIKLPKVKSTKKGKSTIDRSNKIKRKRQKRPEGSEISPKTLKNPKSPKTRKNSKSPKTVTTETLRSAKGVNDENHNGQIMGSKKNESANSAVQDMEEIEVVWSSRPNAETADATVALPKRPKTSPQKPIVVDVIPTMTNVWYDEFQTNLETAVVSDRNRGRSRTVRTRDNNARRGERGRLREIVVDGSNVAMGHSRNKTFSVKGLLIVIDYFKKRGHMVKVFLPQSARARGRDVIEKLHKEGTVIFTPSRKIAGRNITPYDDRFILEYATQCDGIVVSSDQYRDLWAEKPQWRNTIENRLLAPTFVGDFLMFPEDPLGRAGPKLEEFLRY